MLSGFFLWFCFFQLSFVMIATHPFHLISDSWKGNSKKDMWKDCWAHSTAALMSTEASVKTLLTSELSSSTEKFYNQSLPLINQVIRFDLSLQTQTLSQQEAPCLIMTQSHVFASSQSFSGNNILQLLLYIIFSHKASLSDIFMDTYLRKKKSHIPPSLFFLVYKHFLNPFYLILIPLDIKT